MKQNIFIRKATKQDLSRISEIQICNYRINFYPIFKDDEFYFKELQVSSMMEQYESDLIVLQNTYVYDDGVVKGFICLNGIEIKKLFVEPILQGQKIGAALLEYAIQSHSVSFLWVLEKNIRAIKFYIRHGFHVTDDRVFEEGTTEYLVRLER